VTQCGICCPLSSSVRQEGEKTWLNPARRSPLIVTAAMQPTASRLYPPLSVLPCDPAHEPPVRMTRAPFDRVDFGSNRNVILVILHDFLLFTSLASLAVPDLRLVPVRNPDSGTVQGSRQATSPIFIALSNSRACRRSTRLTVSSLPPQSPVPREYSRRGACEITLDIFSF
jgi:hypothetical protein